MALFGANTNVGIIITANAQQAQAALQSLGRSLTNIQSPLLAANTGFKGLHAIWGLMAVGSGAALIKTFVNMAAELQRTKVMIGTFTHDLEKVPEVFNQIVEVSRKSAFSLGEMTSAWVKLKSSGIDPIIDEQGNGPLKALADAVAAFGGDDDIFRRATIAIQQMAGKGVISMEELRQQLGEAIPSAMRVMAEQMHISVGQLIQEVSTGSLEFDRGFKALIDGFEAHFKDIGIVMRGTLIGALQQTRTEFEILSDIMINESGVMDTLSGAVQVFNSRLRDFGEWLKSPAGVAAVQDFNDALLNTIDYAAQAASDLRPLGQMIVQIGENIFNLLSKLPPEMLAGGLIGFLIFGRKGAAVGALAAYVSQFESLVNTIGSGIDHLVDKVTGLIGEEGLEAGLLGWMFFGKKYGVMIAALGAVFGALDDGIERTQQAYKQTEDQFVDSFRKADKPNDFSDTVIQTLDMTKVVQSEQAIREFYRTNIEGAHKAAEAGKQFVAAGPWSKEFDTSRWMDMSEMPDVFDAGLQKLITHGATLRDEINAATEADKSFRAARTHTDDTIAEFLSPGKATMDFLEDVSKKMANLKNFTESGGNAAEIELGKVNMQIDEFNKHIDILKEHLGKSPKDDTFWQKEIEHLTLMRDTYMKLGQEKADIMSGEKFEDVSIKVDTMNESFDQYLHSSDMIAEGTDKVEATFARYQATLDRMRDSILDGTVASKDQAGALAELDALQAKLNEAREAGIAQVQEEVGVKQSAANLDIERAATALETDATLQKMTNDYDEVGKAGLEASQQLTSSLQRVQDEIIQVQKAQADGLITEEAANAAIARLTAVQQSLQSSGQQMIEQAREDASQWGQMMQDIGQQIEDSLGDALYGLVTGTKTAKEVLTDFYNQITRMVIKYLIHQAMVGIFKDGPAGGSGLGSFLSSLFGGGGLLGGFAQGGSFIVGGHGGTDSQTVGFRATPGEVVKVGNRSGNHKGMSGGDGSGYNIHIHAVDADSVARLFMSNGSALVAALRSRHNLNRGM